MQKRKLGNNNLEVSAIGLRPCRRNFAIWVQRSSSYAPFSVRFETLPRLQRRGLG
jgi:hypothetical protein